MKHEILGPGLEFEALSYGWEPESPQQEILCNGKSVRVGWNLFKALETLRPTPHGQQRALWVDALCINQADKEEKTEQVKIMRHVYSKAKRTIVWLGEEDNNSSLGMKIASELSLLFMNHIAEKEIQELQQSSPKAFEEQLQRLVVDYRQKNMPGFIGFTNLSLRVYFSRVWIIQEILVSVAPYLVCGSASIPLQSLLDLSSLVLRNSQARFGIIEFTSEEWQIGSSAVSAGVLRDALSEYRSEHRPSLATVLQRHRNFEASFPQDKIFALVGITDIV